MTDAIAATSGLTDVGCHVLAAAARIVCPPVGEQIAKAHSLLAADPC